LATLVVALSACQVNTQISVDAGPGGGGVVAVTISLDGAATSAIGGRSALAAQLQDADLVQGGWTVTGPSAGPGSSTVVTASHIYDTPAQASALVGELAGTGPSGARPFQFSVATRHSFWRTDTTLVGKVDLTCGLACFGDAGLKTALGFPTGVNPGPLTATAGEQPDQVFTFSLRAQLPGSLVSSNATSLPDGTLQWAPKLGQTLSLAAATRSWDRARIVGVAIAAGALVLILLALLAFWWWRRRRRRRRRAGPAGRSARRRGGRYRKPRGRVRQAVTPPS
jgi:hypothetical protein